ncbi:hypothetical protein OUZ56_022105 [Daphnia magna]|uniref:Uncharacterized protein n=1 Tax=Daphnia magna TaxID=35525 RepID=A0ABR0AVI1_9CRUS|nr:hypothetical protein OUZ56_022105 [Daphnia magna]
MKKKFTVERPTPTTPIENRRRLIGPPLVNARNHYMDPSARKKKEEGAAIDLKTRRGPGSSIRLVPTGSRHLRVYFKRRRPSRITG